MFIKRAKTFFHLFFILCAVNSSISVNLNCNFDRKNYENYHNVDSCIQKDALNISNDNAEIKLVNGLNRMNSNVNAVSIIGKNIQYIPTNLASKFEFLTALQINNGRLKGINQKAFKNINYLQFLDLSDNDIVIIGNDTFQFNKMLTILWLSNNLITKIAVNSFNNSKSLIQLDLSNNICISESAVTKRAVMLFLEKVYSDCEAFDIKKLYQVIRLLRISNEKLTNFSENLKAKIKSKDERIAAFESEISQLSLEISRSTDNPELLITNQDINTTNATPILNITKRFIRNSPKPVLILFFSCLFAVALLTVLDICLFCSILF